MTDLPPLKRYQAEGHARAEQCRERDPGNPTLIVGPCGSGKSRLMFEAARAAMARGEKCGILTHRQMLTDQLSADFDRAGVPHTIFAAGYDYDPSKPVQIMSTPTVYARCFKSGKAELPNLGLIQVDEAHQQTGEQAKAVMFGAYKEGDEASITDGYVFKGTSVMGYTATPIMKNQLYGQMVDIGSYRLMREEKMHLPVKVYAPNEIDVQALGSKNASGNYSERKLEKVFANDRICGSVFANYGLLNPGQLPMILFAPSVAASKWFASSFCDRGVPVAHLDGNMIGFPQMDRGIGQRLYWEPAGPENRKMLLEMHRDGVIKGIANRFVLREAVNMPWCYHAILATVMGGLSTYLQAVGRLQRYWDAYPYKILQCHGGHYWRHGSPNEDRIWKLGQSNRDLAKLRIQEIKTGKRPEGIRCRCGAWRMGGPICHSCGLPSDVSMRAVMQTNGKLEEQRGSVYTLRNDDDEVQKLWKSTLFRMSHGDKPVSSAVGLFLNECEEKHLTVNWRKLQFAPPMHSSPDYHRSVNTVYPWLQRRKARK